MIACRANSFWTGRYFYPVRTDGPCFVFILCVHYSFFFPALCQDTPQFNCAYYNLVLIEV